MKYSCGQKFISPVDKNGISARITRLVCCGQKMGRDYPRNPHFKREPIQNICTLSNVQPAYRDSIQSILINSANKSLLPSFLFKRKEELSRAERFDLFPTVFYIASHIGPGGFVCSKVGISVNTRNRIADYRRFEDSSFKIYASIKFPLRFTARIFERHIYKSFKAYKGREYLDVSPSEVLEFCCNLLPEYELSGESVWVSPSYQEKTLDFRR